MDKIAIGFRCSELAKKRAIIVLDIISSISSIAFNRSDSNPQILYGEAEGKPDLHIPYIEYEAEDSEWGLFNHSSRLMVPGFIQRRSLQVEENKLGIDLFGLAYKFLTMGLADKGQARWSPEVINTQIRHVYPFFQSFVALFVESLKTSGIIHENYQISSPWPQNAPFALGLSHDLDIYRRKFLGSIGILAKSVYSSDIPGGVGGSMKGLTHTIKAIGSAENNPYNQFRSWFGVEDQSTIFLFAGERRSANDPTYKIETVAKDMAVYDSSKFNLAYHNGINTSDDPDTLRANKSVLENLFNTPVKGIRPHYLDFKLPSFWRNIGDFEYSSSVGSDTIPGFTSGINFPFYGFDLESAVRIDVLEIPIGLMDCALFSIKDKVLRERTIDDIIANCRDSRGLLVLDWHIRTAYNPDYPGWFDTYNSVLEKAKSSGAYIASLDTISDYWRKRCESVSLS